MTPEERSLIANCVSGEKASWDAFVHQYSNLVYNIIRKTLTLHHVDSRNEVVEDLYQEFFVSILQNECRKLSQFRGDDGCTLASFLRVVAARLTIDSLRQLHQPTADVLDNLASDEPTATDRLMAQETEKALAAVLATLSGRERLLIELHYRRGLAAEEVAAMLKISAGAFYTQKSRLLGKLRELLVEFPSL